MLRQQWSPRCTYIYSFCEKCIFNLFAFILNIAEYFIISHFFSFPSVITIFHNMHSILIFLKVNQPCLHCVVPHRDTAKQKNRLPEPLLFVILCFLLNALCGGLDACCTLRTSFREEPPQDFVWKQADRNFAKEDWKRVFFFQSSAVWEEVLLLGEKCAMTAIPLCFKVAPKSNRDEQGVHLDEKGIFRERGNVLKASRGLWWIL